MVDVEESEAEDDNIEDEGEGRGVVDIEDSLVGVDGRDEEGGLEGAEESDVRADPEEIVDASDSEFADVDAVRDALLT